MISLAVAKAQLRVTFTQDDALIARLIDAATAKVARDAGLRLDEPGTVTEAQWGTGTPRWYLGQDIASGEPVVTKATGPGGTAETLTAGEDYVRIGRALHRTTGVWSTRTWYAAEYEAGYAEGEAPADLQQAALMLVGHWYENPSAVITGTISGELQQGYRDLIAGHRKAVL